MYAGTTLKQLRLFDAWFGAHQKIDRIARGNLDQLLPKSSFPTKRQIIQFEGIDGPDGIKRKTPAQDEPWHFYNPTDPDDTQLIGLIEAHYDNLVEALRTSNQARSAFEAAWLAHAVVDGLTPAHHYPYEDELIRLRGGAGIETRTTPKDKLLIPGDTIPQRVSNNWQMWGDKGLLATHLTFEWGIAVIIMPLRLRQSAPSKDDTALVIREGISKLFVSRAKYINDLHIYEQYYKSGWTPKLAKTARRELVPTIINTVTLVWYAALREAAK